MAIRHTLLGLLGWEPMHGYRLRQVAQAYSWMYPMTNASVYPALHELEREGFIVHDTEVHNGRARKVYRITDRGRGELRRWLAIAPEGEASLRDQMLLKVSMLDDTTLPAASGWLDDAIDQIRQQLADSIGEATDDTQTPYTRISREYGHELLRLRLRLLERVREVESSERSASAS
jgi:DNA-binding PadR family transcriptional regulator